MLHLNKNARIGIAGGGLVGRLLAWQLLEQGHHVTLFDAGSFEQSLSAANTAAGMVSPVSEAIDTEALMYDLGMVAVHQWPQWLDALASAMPNEPRVAFSHQGSLIVAHQRDHSLLQQYGHDMQRQLPAQAKSHWVDNAAIAELEPDLAEHFHRGLYFSEEAHIDNRQLLATLHKRIVQLGGECVADTKVNAEAFTLIEVDGGKTHTFDCAIDARGVGAKPEWKNIRGVRGEVLHVRTDEVTLQRPVRLLHPRYQLYVVPKPDNEFVIGATQIESEDRSPMSVQSTLELSSALYAINPAFAEARVIEMDVNLRPALNNNRPQIQYDKGLVRVNGLYRHGYLVAPAVIQHALALLLESEQPIQDFSSLLYADLNGNLLAEEDARAHAIR